jgi:hypothetical protein
VKEVEQQELLAPVNIFRPPRSTSSINLLIFGGKINISAEAMPSPG